MSLVLASLASALLLPSLATPAQDNTAPPQPCATVHGRYAIYADGDRLWITGSKHFLDVSSGDLDRQLRDRDWTKTLVFGDFTLCAPHLKDPRQLTIQDHVTLKSYSNLQFRPR